MTPAAVVRAALTVAMSVALIGGSSATAGSKKPTEAGFVASGPVVFADSAVEGESEALAGEKVVIRYYKKQNGKWVLKHEEKPVIEGSIGFGDSSPAHFKKGTCKMVVKFPGNAEYAPSKESKRYDCKTGMIDYSS